MAIIDEASARLDIQIVENAFHAIATVRHYHEPDVLHIYARRDHGLWDCLCVSTYNKDDGYTTVLPTGDSSPLDDAFDQYTEDQT